MDARIVRTRESLIQAIDAALHAGDEKLPSITELCAAAGISRPTFYQHFGDVPSRVAAAGVDGLQKMFDAAASERPPSMSSEEATPGFIRTLIEQLFSDGDYYRRVLDASDTHAFQESVVEYLVDRLLAFSPLGEGAGDDAERAHRARAATFIAAGVTWLVVAWIKQGPDRPSVAAAADEVTRLLVTSITAQVGAEASRGCER